MTTNRFSRLLAAAVAVTGLVWGGFVSTRAEEPKSEQAKTPNQQSTARKGKAQPAEFYIIIGVPASRPVVQPVGGTLAPDVEQIRDTLASATEAAFTPDGFDDLVERLVDADRNRIGRTQLTDKDLPTLDGRIKQIRKAWKDKYGREFDLDDEAAVYGNYSVVQGEITRHGAQLAAASESPADRIAGNDRGDRNLDPGRNVAVVTVPKSQSQGQAQSQSQSQSQRQAGGMKELSVLMIHELPDSWKIDVPDQVSGRNIYDNLLKHLTQFGENVQNWPASEQEAYRQATHHVLSALTGHDAKPGQTE